MKNKQNSRPSGGNPRRKGDFRHEKGKPPPAKQNDGKEKGARPSTGGGNRGWQRRHRGGEPQE